MPMYEYRCDTCGEEFEELVLDQDELVECPSCPDGGVVIRKMSVFGFKSSGASRPAASTGGSCGSCTSHNCGSCGH